MKIILHISNSCAAIQIQCNNIVAIKSKHPEMYNATFYCDPRKLHDINNKMMHKNSDLIKTQMSCHRKKIADCKKYQN